jgi:hypothetical protein
MRLDLTDATIDELALELNAGSVRIIASASTSLSGQIQQNAGSVRLCVPTTAGLRITSSGMLLGTNLDSSGLTRSGDTWESASYASARQKITLSVAGNAASFDLNPSGGCE